MHKCLFEISDYCEFNWWNSCSYFDAMFGYVNWMLNKLLLLILHTWIVVVWDFVVVDCDEFMFKWSCCWIGCVILLICIMGVPFCEVVVWIGEVCVELSCEGPKWILMYKVVDWVFGVVAWVRLSIISVFTLWLW